jgi:hypothetical protein
MIAAGDPIDARDGLGRTPLMTAAAAGHASLVRRLLAAGADAEARNARGQDALVLASIGNHAEASQLLRDRLLTARGLKAGTAASAVGVQFQGLPTDKKGVFMGGLPRHPGNGEGLAVTPEENKALAEEMLRTMPLSTLDTWLKQVDATQLNPMGMLALDHAFPHFLTFLDFDEDQAHNALLRRGYGVGTFAKGDRARRFAGDNTLPRGRYFTLCKNPQGDDGDTLQAELWAYYRPDQGGSMAMLDSGNEALLAEFEQKGWWKLPRLSVPYIGLMFGPSEEGTNPFAQLAGVEPPNAPVVLLPLAIRKERIERVLDLRRPEATNWLARFFSRLVIATDASAGIRDWMRCTPLRPPVDDIGPMLPTLLTQERGGGIFDQMVGCWLRRNGVQGLVYPSVRNDPSVTVHEGQVQDWHGWNFVDYRDAQEPYFVAYLDMTDYWEDKVRVGLGLDVGQLPDWDPYFRVQVAYTAHGPRRDSWNAQGIVAMRLAIIHAQLAEMGRSEAQPTARPRGWVAQLPLGADVKEWVKLFIAGDYAECVRRGLGLLPHIESFEVLQMFLLSLQRQGHQPAGGGWAADEVLEQLGPQVLAHHAHLPELQILLSVTLGRLDPEATLRATNDATMRCRINYYAAARLISQGYSEHARPYLEACLERPGECLESHLALEARRDLDERQ